MDSKLELRFLAQACSVRPHPGGDDWRATRSLINGLVGLAGTLRCGASDAFVADLAGLPFTGPVVTRATATGPASIELLVHKGPLDTTSGWVDDLAAGAVVLAIGTNDPAFAAEGAVHVTLDVGSGVSITQLSGGKFEALNSFLGQLGDSEAAQTRLALVLTALEGRIAREERQILRNEGLDQRIDVLNERVGALTAQTAEQDRSIHALQATINRQDADRGQLMGGLQEAQAMLTSLMNSGSWSILRKIRSARRRILAANDALSAVATLQTQPAMDDDMPGMTEPTSKDDLLTKIPEIARWFQEHGMRPGGWVDPQVMAALQAHDLTLVAKSFYSVCPDVALMGPDDWRPNKYQAAWECVNKRDFGEILTQLQTSAKALENAPRETPDAQGVFFWGNEMFSPMDAVSYRAIIQHVRPKQILEVGSGNSTAIALGVGQEIGTQVRCIEPYPSPFLQALESRLSGLIQSKVEDVDPEIYRELNADDILFIDSSHCARMSSDLNFLMFEALPRLKAGVVVHFHDIFLPNEYPETWLRDVGIMWNEQYQLLAFLMNNADYELIWSSSNAPAALGDRLTDALKDAVSPDHPIFGNIGPYGGGSVWLRKLN